MNWSKCHTTAWTTDKRYLLGKGVCVRGHEGSPLKIMIIYDCLIWTYKSQTLSRLINTQKNVLKSMQMFVHNYPYRKDNMNRIYKNLYKQMNLSIAQFANIYVHLNGNNHELSMNSLRDKVKAHFFVTNQPRVASTWQKMRKLNPNPIYNCAIFLVSSVMWWSANFTWSKPLYPVFNSK